MDLIDQYGKNALRYPIRKKLLTLRNERLAHRQTEASVGAADASDSEIEEFYQDNSTLVSQLLHLVEAMVYDPGETAEVYRHHAAYFWAGVRGERKIGHPDYRALYSAENI